MVTLAIKFIGIYKKGESKFYCSSLAEQSMFEFLEQCVA